MRPLCPTRWTVRIRSIESILKTYPAILDFLEQLANANEECSAQAKGLHDQLEKGTTLFGLLLCKTIFGPTEELSTLLQKPAITASGTIEAATTTVTFLEELKISENFEVLWDETQKLIQKYDLIIPTLPRRRKIPKRYVGSLPVAKNYSSPKEMCQIIYKEAFNKIINEINRRFKDVGFQKFQQLESVLLNDEMLPENVKKLCDEYEIDLDRIFSQTKVLSQKFPNSTAPKIIEDFASLTNETRSLFSEVFKLCRILIVLPSSSASAERSFSMLRRIKTYLRSTMTQTRLNNLCILNAYPEMVDEILVDDLMSDFINNSHRQNLFGT